MLLPETLKLHNKADFEFHYIYFLPWKDQMVKAIEVNGGRVTCLSAKNNLALMLQGKRLLKYVKDHKIDIIHAHLPWAGILCRIVGALGKVTVLYTEHNKQERYHRITRVLNLLTMNLLSEVIAVSDDVADSIHAHKKKLKCPVQVLKNGVNTDHFRRDVSQASSVRSKLAISETAFVIGTIAVFRSQKRLHLWLEIAKRISGLDKSARFIMVGDGPLKDELLQTRAKLGMEDIVFMPGLETEVRPYLQAFDLYMMSSEFEGLPLALLEAMSMECAVISTAAGGIKEVIKHNLNGILVPVDEPNKSVEYAMALRANPDTARLLGAEARLTVLSEFSMKKMVSELELLYKRHTTR